MHEVEYSLKVFRALCYTEVHSYWRKKSVSACFITARPTSAIAVVSGMSFGQISTQFCAKPHSWMPPSPISACSRSAFCICPVGCVLNRRTWPMVAAPTKPVPSLNCGHTSMQQQHEMQREYGYACS